MSLCSRCERFDIQAFGRSRYAYVRLPFSNAVKSSEQGCSFCSLLVENLATSYILNRSWLSTISCAIHVELQANRDHSVTEVDGGGLATYQITAKVVKLSLWTGWAGLRILNINVSADQGKQSITTSICPQRFLMSISNSDDYI